MRDDDGTRRGAPSGRCCRRAHVRRSARSRNSIGTSARSSNSSIAKAVLPTGLSMPEIGSTSAVDESASARPSATALEPACRSRAARRRSTPRSRSARRCRARTPAPHRSKAPEADVQPDGEEQQDDAELGEGLDRLPVADREERLARDAAAPARRARTARSDSDEDEADDRRDLEPGEGRDDDASRAEDHQRVLEPGPPSSPAIRVLEQVQSRLSSAGLGRSCVSLSYGGIVWHPWRHDVTRLRCEIRIRRRGKRPAKVTPKAVSHLTLVILRRRSTL